MSIDPLNIPSNPALRPNERAGSARPTEQAAAAPQADVKANGLHTADLVAKLKELPEVRPEVVELGRQLAAAPDYPPDEMIDRLAQILVEDGAFTEDEQL